MSETLDTKAMRGRACALMITSMPSDVAAGVAATAMDAIRACAELDSLRAERDAARAEAGRLNDAKAVILGMLKRVESQTDALALAGAIESVLGAALNPSAGE